MLGTDEDQERRAMLAHQAEGSEGYRSLRARFDESTITVYQAYNDAIADAALAAQTFVPPFLRDRATWIKPSFCWMMYRSGFATKKNQERILAIDLRRAGFEEALAASCLSHFDPSMYSDVAMWRTRLAEATVRIQWDPERTLTLQPLPYRSLQIGLTKSSVGQYCDAWIVRIRDVTPLVREVKTLLDAGQLDAAQALMPDEREYTLLRPELAQVIGLQATRSAVTVEATLGS